MEKKLGIVLILITIVLFGCSITVLYFKPSSRVKTTTNKKGKQNGINKVIKNINNTEKQLNNITNMINATGPGNETTNVLPNQTIKNQSNNTTELNNTSSIVSVVNNISNVTNITDVLI